MDHGEIIESQISLLVKLNEQLAGQATPVATREIRENVKLIIELANHRGSGGEINRNRGCTFWRL